MEIAFLKSAFRESHYPPQDKPEIAFAGRSNVGKSTLLNVLVNRKKAGRTSSRPGRTQAINFFCVDNQYYFVDLPGYGFARVPLSVKASWGRMVETYLMKRANLKGVVVILDIRRDPTEGDMDLIHWLKHYDTNPILVLTKADKLSRQKSNARAKIIGAKLEGTFSLKPILFSAKTGEGREDIWKALRSYFKM